MWNTVWRHKILVVFLMILGGALGYSTIYVLTPIYTSSATIFVTVSGAKDSTDVSQTGAYLTSRMTSYTALGTSAAVLKDALTPLSGTDAYNSLLTAADRASGSDELSAASNNLARQVTVDNPTNTTVLNVSVNGDSPSDAQRLTDGVSASLAQQIEETEQGSDAFTPVRATVINDAILPVAPSFPKPYFNAVIGAILGAALGIAIAVLRASRRPVGIQTSTHEQQPAAVKRSGTERDVTRPKARRLGG
jgi:succinoglycan biosynthesis transport protein ExoP